MSSVPLMVADHAVDVPDVPVQSHSASLQMVLVVVGICPGVVQPATGKLNVASVGFR